MSKSYFLYKNIRTGKFSMTFDGIVVEKVAALKLFDVHFNVSEPGRQRVLKEKRKNVHAKLQASDFKLLEEGSPISRDGWREVTYNPYRDRKFVFVDTGDLCESASEVLCVAGKVYV